jgi:hypothetical protein
VAGIDPQPHSDTPLKIQAWEVPASRHHSAAPKGKSRCGRRVYSPLSCMKSLAAGGTSTWGNTCPYVTKRKRPLASGQMPACGARGRVGARHPDFGTRNFDDEGVFTDPQYQRGEGPSIGNGERSVQECRLRGLVLSLPGRPTPKPLF